MSDTEQSGTGFLSLTTERLREKAQERADEIERRREQAKKNFEGNRPGRPKGSKNKLTLLKQAVLAKAEQMVLEDWEEVVQTTLTLAKAGDTQCLKILWDRVIPSKRAIDDSKGTTDKMNVTINISGLEVKSVMDEAVEAEYVEVEDG